MTSDLPGEPAGADDRLACGNSRADLLDLLVHDDVTGNDHVAGCPYCRSALAELTALHQVVREAARVPPQVPAGLVSRVLRRVGQEARRTPSWIGPGDDGRGRGELWIRDRVLETLVRDWTAEIDGVRTATVTFDGIRLGVEVAATYGIELHLLAGRISRTIEDRIATALLVSRVPVDVTIVDVRRVA